MLRKILSIIINCGKKTFVKIIHISIERIKRKIDKSFANLKKEQEIETYPFWIALAYLRRKEIHGSSVYISLSRMIDNVT